MVTHDIEPDDIETLSQILEDEKRSHRRKRFLCFAMFVFSFICLVLALVLVAIRLVTVATAPAGAGALGMQFAMLQVLVPLAAVALSFFGAWWGVQNCLNSIERTLCAARNRRPQLFAVFFKEIQCAGKDKQRAWLEIIKSAVM
jgi:hypothetical protein